MDEVEVIEIREIVKHTRWKERKRIKIEVQMLRGKKEFKEKEQEGIEMIEIVETIRWQ